MGRVAIEKNRQAFLDLELPGTRYVVGNGPDLGRLRSGYPNVVFTGHRFGEEPAAHVAAVNVFVFPSPTDTKGTCAGARPGHNGPMTVSELETGSKHHTTLAVATLIVAVSGLLLAFSAMMALFLGAEGPGLRSLLSLIGWMLPPTAVMCILCLLSLGRPGDGRLALCWSRLPAWLVLMVGMLIILALLAELAIWLVEFTGGGKVRFGHYVPIAGVLLFSLALTTGYALIAPPGEGGRHRGPVRHTDPIRRDPG